MKRQRNRITVIILLSLILSALLTNKTMAKTQSAFNFKVEKEILNYPRKLGEVLEVVFTVSSPYDLNDTRFMLFSMKGLQLISLEPIGFVAREETDERYLKKRSIDKWLWFEVKANEELQFKLKAKINDRAEEKNLNTIPVVSISVGVESWTEEHRSGQGGQNFGLFLIDEKTGLLSTKSGLIRELPVEYRYDAVDGTFYKPGELDVPVNVEWNRRIIKMMKELEPALSDSEALLLHSDHYRIGIPQDAIYWDKKEECWMTNEKKMFQIFLKDGWYDALKEGVRNSWIETEKEKIKGQRNNEEKGGSSKAKFFPRGYSPGDNYFDNSDRISKPFCGWWKFKDHLYNKTQGLLASANRSPVVYGKARLLITYWYNSQFHRELTIYDETDSNGYFHIEFEIPQTATNCKAYPIVYPSGPNSYCPVVDLTDPNITQPSYWKDSDDSTLFIMRELGYATPHDFLPNSNLLNLDTVWTDTFPAVSLPQSGCINIYQILLRARTLSTPNPTDPLRAIWEPAYIPIHGADTVWTSYLIEKDTIYVSGCTLSVNYDTDEWDDDILYHEFGHYQMDFFDSGFDPWQKDTANYNRNHSWWLDDTSYKAIAWIEGWANFFSGYARAGSVTDTFFVNTDKKIGDGKGSKFYYYNLENPWDYSLPDSFQGGEFCEGAVTGILFDIYDSYNEDPYPLDTSRSDSLARGFDSVFTIMSDFDPPDPDTSESLHCTNCWGLVKVQLYSPPQVQFYSPLFLS